MTRALLPDGGRVHLVRTHPGTGAFDGVFEHTETPTRWFGARMRYVNGQWEMTFRDGTPCAFDQDWGLLQGIRDRFGNAIPITLGSNQADLRRIEASNGRWLGFSEPPHVHVRTGDGLARPGLTPVRLVYA